MKHLKKIIFCLLLTFCFFACTNETKDKVANKPPEKVLNRFESWWEYHNQNIHFSENYTPLDSNAKEITKDAFFLEMIHGNFVPIRVLRMDSVQQYQLYPLSDSADNDLKIYAKQIAEDAYHKYKLEGMKIPDFNFTDLNGNKYDSTNTKGKVIVLKCWFIHCQSCVQEMPALNELVKYYQNRKDVLFISMAYDSTEKLKKFLSNTKFDYAVIPTTASYMEDKLKVTGYPTQFVINREGKISKVMNDYKEMIAALKIELNK